MARIVEYCCDHCGKTYEEVYNDTEDQLEYLDRDCECGGKFVKGDNLKRNPHRWYHNDGL
jgi:hypothetical protein